MATNESLNNFAIWVSVNGDEQLTKLGQSLRALKTDADNLASALGGKPIQAIRNADAQVKGNKKVMSSSEKRRRKIERDQKAEQASMNATNQRMRLQSIRFEKYNRKIQGASRLTKNEITDMFRRVALWSTGIGVLFGTLSKVKFIFGAVKDLEVQMVELKKVMDDDTPFKTARQELFKTALSMSVSVDQAAEIAKIWAQQGYELNEVSTLTRTALLGVNSANLTATQSVEFLTSAMRSFNLEAHETVGAIDSIMAIQADFAITAQNLAKGMQVAGAITAQLGGDMNELFGMMTAIGQVTRETGNVIGNSLKTQLARLQQPRTIQYLNQLGIATRRLTDEGVVRRLSAFDVFKQIAQRRKEGTLTQDQVLDIALKIGGVRKFKDALVLIENFDQAVQSMQTGFLAYGDAADASQKIQDTLTRKLDKLNTAFVELGDTIANMGELSNMAGLKAIIDLLTSGVQGMTALAKGESILGGVGSAAFQAIPLAIIGGFAKFLGKRVFQNIRGTEMRQIQQFMDFNAGGAPLSRATAQTQYTFFGKQAFQKGSTFRDNMAKELRNIRKQAKLAGISVGEAGKQMAVMNIASKNAVGGMANLNTRFRILNKIGGRTAIALRSIGANLFPGKFIPKGGSALGGAGGSPGLATARIFGSLTSLFKGLAATGAIILAIEGLIKAVEYIQGLQPKRIEFDGVVDPASEASVAFKELAASLTKLKDEARDANTDLSELIANRSLSDVALDLQPIAEKAGTALFAGLFEGLDKEIPQFNADLFKQFIQKRKIEGINIPETDAGLEELYNNITKTLKTGAIQNRAQLKRYLRSLGIDEADLPTEEATKKFQKIFRDFLKFEIAGDLATEAKEANKYLGELLDKLKEGFKDATVDIDEGLFAKALKTPATGITSPFGNAAFANLIKAALADLTGVNEADRLFSAFVQGFANNAQSISKAFEEANQSIEGKSLYEIFGIEDEEKIASAIVKISKKWEEVSKSSDKLPPLDEILGQYLDKNLGTFSGGAEIRSVVPEGQQGLTTSQESLQILRDAAKSRIDKSLKATASSALELVRSITGLERTLPNSLYAVSDAALDASYALLKIPDRIFNALSKYVADIEKIKISRSLSGLLGVGTTPSKDILEATRSMIRNISTIYPAVADSVRQQENVNERIKRIFEGNTKAVKAIGSIVKKADDDVISEAVAITELGKLVDAPEYKDIKNIKPAVREAINVIKDLFKVREQEALLTTDVDTAIRSWKALRQNILDVTGIDIGSEVIIKDAFEAAGRNLDPNLLKDIFRRPLEIMLNNAVDAVNQANFKQLDLENKKQVNNLLDYSKRLRRTGNLALDTQNGLMIDHIKNMNELNLDAQYARDQLKGVKAGEEGDADRFTLLTEIASIEAKKKSAEQTYILNSALEDYAVQAERIHDATMTARDAFKQLFADIKRFDPNTNDISYAIEDALNQIANTRLERVGENLSEQLLAGFDKYTGSSFGEFLLGEKIQDPFDTAVSNFDKSVITFGEIVAMLNPNAENPLAGARSTVGEFDARTGKFGFRTTEIIKELDKLPEVLSEGVDKIKINFEDIAKGLGQVAGGVAGGLVAGAAGKQTNAVNIGTAFGGVIGGLDIFSFLGSFANPIFSVIGGIFGGLFGRDKEQVKQTEKLEQIVNNTAALIDVDSRLINAPADFTLPVGATTGGAIQWSGDIVVNGVNDSVEAANAIRNEINRMMGRGTSTYNVVGDRIS